MTSSGFDVELVTSLDRLHDLEAELWSLFSAANEPSPFQSPAWLLSWAECFSGRDAIRALVVRRGGMAVGLLPWIVRARRGERVAEIMGRGISDYLDGLIDPNHSEQVLACFAAGAQQFAQEVDAFEVSDVPRDSPLLTLVRRIGTPRVEACAHCPRVPLGSSLAEHVPRLPAWLRRNLAQGEKRLAQAGTSSMELAEPETLPRLLETFFDLHASRWRARAEPGVLHDPAVRAFHRRAAPRLLRRGAVELSVLSIDRRPAAATLILLGRDAHLYLTGFDPSFARFNPGTVVIGRAVARACASGRAHFDFLRGEERYKYAWGATNRPTYRARFALPVRSANTAAELES